METNEDVSFFIAGTMQGAGTGSQCADQSYRLGVVAAIRDAYPLAVIRCPLVLMSAWCRDDEMAYRQAHAEAARRSILERAGYSEGMQDLADMFGRLVRLAGEADVLVACLPDREPSMGTAMEMWSAFSQGRTVISITGMAHNLAILGASHIIVPDIEGFSRVLSGEWLKLRLEAGR